MAKNIISTLGERFSTQDDELEAAGFKAGTLDVRIHEARGIHNICIYDNQDVFAKFTFTHGKGEAYSTAVVTKGGKNPVFNESFQLVVTVPDSVLKCEMWMSSRAHSYLEDQLLGFVLVPLSDLAGIKNGKAEDYGLSSTELFHSPAGTVRLTLEFRESPSLQAAEGPSDDDSQAAEVSIGACPFIKVFGTSSEQSEESEYRSVQFPDLQAAREDEKLVSDFLKCGTTRDANGIITGPHFLFESGLAEETTKKKSKKKSEAMLNSKQRCNNSSSSSRSSSSNSSNAGVQSEKELGSSPASSSDAASSDDKQEECGGKMQQQIMDMYVKSMQQFTEALAKMQLPIDLDASKSEPSESSSPNAKKKNRMEGSKPHRVFYGSRAFF